ncbi:hypothetical protein ACVWXL_004161 [Bradyrhizobium sp. GM22.5]
MLEEAVERRNPVLHPGMRQTVADDPVVRDDHAAAIGIEPHLFRKHLGAFRQIGMDLRCDLADRWQIGGAGGTPMRLAHVDPSSISIIPVYSDATRLAAKNIFAAISGIRRLARRPTHASPLPDRRDHDVIDPPRAHARNIAGAASRCLRGTADQDRQDRQRERA